MPTRIVIDQQAIEAFCRRWGVIEFDLFGLVIRDDFRADSDVDVLASFSDDRRPTLLTLLQMEAELEQLFGRKVDLLERGSVERATTTYDANTYSRTVSRYMWRDQAYLLDMPTAARDARDSIAA